MVILHYVPIALLLQSPISVRSHKVCTQIHAEVTPNIQLNMQTFCELVFTSVSSIVANIGKSLLFEMIQVTQCLSQSLYESRVDL